MQAPKSNQDAALALPPELARFWTAFATSQIRKGRRDVGAMVQAALQYLFERGAQRLKPMMRSQEDLEAFRNALKEEFARIDKALDAAAGAAILAAPYTPKQFRIVRRDDNSKTPAEAVQVTLWPHTLRRRDDITRYRTALDKQWRATLQALEDHTKRLVEARQQVQAQLIPFSPAFYQIGEQLLAQFNATQQPVTSANTARPVDKAEPQPPAVSQAKETSLRAAWDRWLQGTQPGMRPPGTPSASDFEKWLAALNCPPINDLPTDERTDLPYKLRKWFASFWRESGL